MIDRHHGWNVSFKPVIIGFVLLVIATLASYRILTHSHLSASLLTFVLVALASLQGLIELIFFLHLGLESKPRWNAMMFLYVLLVMIILIGGSMWIMQNLNYQMHLS